MAHEFDPGPVEEPFRTLAAGYPGADAYPPADFRVEWGPIFHRGRLDGSARVLVLGQDPGQHESIARRILVGEAGQRVQGFLLKLGVERAYAMLNAFLYSVYGQSGGERHAANRRIVRYRHRWLDALLVDTDVRAAVAFGHLAEDAIGRWRRTERGRAAKLAVEALPHPTMPEASSKGDEAKRAAAMKGMLGEWNGALERLSTLGLAEVERPLSPYGDDLEPDDLAPIPERDLPAGAPPWWRSLSEWAARRGDTAEEKRARIEVVVPKGERPGHRAPRPSGPGPEGAAERPNPALPEGILPSRRTESSRRCHPSEAAVPRGGSSAVRIGRRSGSRSGRVRSGASPGGDGA